MAQAVVGLGNPGPKYRGTRHNVGHVVLDRLADLLRAQGKSFAFSAYPRLGQIAAGVHADDALFLFKPASYMNESGAVVKRFIYHYRDCALTPADLILVYDDIDLPVGKVRVRLKGSAGGHRGVQSVIERLGTEALRRVKVGIGRPSSKDEVVDHVLARFAPDELPLIESACAEAAERVLKLLESALSRNA